jgi:hypothetical protein
MDFKLQLQNIADLSRRLANYCDDSLDNDTDIMSEAEQNRNTNYTLNTIIEQMKIINEVINVDWMPLNTLERCLKEKENRNESN